MNSGQTHENSSIQFQRSLPKGVRYPLSILLLALGAGGAILSYFGSYSEGEQLLNKWFVERALYIVSILHIVLVIIVLLPSRLKVDMFRQYIYSNTGVEESNFISKHQAPYLLYKLESFIKYWRYLWLSWGLMYIFFFLNADWQKTSQYMLYSENVSSVIGSLMNMFNNLGTYAMFFLYLSLTSVTKKSTHDDKNLVKEEKKSVDRIKFWFKVVLLIITLTDLSISAIPGLSLNDFFSIFSGVSAALAFAYLSGRLDSMYIQTEPFWSVFLFSYAALQASFPTYTLDYELLRVATSVAYAAFVFKILLFLFVLRNFENWKIHYYLIKSTRVGSISIP